MRDIMMILERVDVNVVARRSMPSEHGIRWHKATDPGVKLCWKGVFVTTSGKREFKLEAEAPYTDPEQWVLRVAPDDGTMVPYVVADEAATTTINAAHAICQYLGPAKLILRCQSDLSKQIGTVLAKKISAFKSLNYGFSNGAFVRH